MTKFRSLWTELLASQAKKKKKYKVFHKFQYIVNRGRSVIVLIFLSLLTFLSLFDAFIIIKKIRKKRIGKKKREKNEYVDIFP